MNRKEFMRDYWRYYRSLEDKFILTSSYVEIHKENFSTFSNEYASLLRSIGAELDNFFKVYSGFDLNERKNIKDYACSILNSYPEIVNQKIEIRDLDIEIQPFLNWNINTPAQSLVWWDSFVNIKHNRVENMKSANLENVLNILGALFLLEMKYLGIIVKKDSNGQLRESDVPDEKSKLFSLKDWNFRYVLIGEHFALIDGHMCQLVY